MARKRRIEPRSTAAAPPPAPSRVEPALPWTNREWIIIALLVAANIFVFGQLASHSFLNYDDGQFITENEFVKQGLTGESIRWALTASNIGWYPTTWLSHMLDAQLWGVTSAAGHLLTGLLLHTLSTLMLFLALRRMTTATLRSAFVAALFAIHPMHVESVAWASERKDTLSTFFAMATLLAYAYLARERSTRKHVILGVTLALGMMAKQMLVTLPFVLLLLDYWPLERVERTLRDWRAALPLVKEKLGLIAIALIGTIAAVIGQRNLNAFQSTEVFPLGQRLANAMLSYVRYIEKLFWPFGLAVPYPMQPVSALIALASVAFLIVVTFLVIRYRTSAPYLLTGWLWYLGTLLPVIGIVQIGSQAMADRYSYIPYVGLFIMIVWGVADLGVRFRVPDVVVRNTGIAVVVVLMIIAWRQTKFWVNSETLFQHTLDVTGPNPQAEYNVGQALQMKDPDRAIPHLERGIRMIDDSLRANRAAVAPDWFAQSHVAIGTALVMKAQAAKAHPEEAAKFLDDAERHFHEALRIDPNAPHAKRNIEVAEQTRMQLAPGTQLASPDQIVNVLLNGGVLSVQQGKMDDALKMFAKAVEIKPNDVEVRVYYALGLAQANKRSEALQQVQKASALDAAKANELLTKAMQIPPDPMNLRNFELSLSAQ